MSLYVHNRQAHNENAAKIVVPLLIDLIDPKSVIDIGCGIGSWLSVFQQHGIEIQGIDGEHVNKELLYIDEAKIIFSDLRLNFEFEKKYDLALCLEVAEHLPEENADSFVKNIVNTSDFILWAAAIPGQGGQNHLNEQPYEYWKEKFKKHNFDFFDVIRPKIWNNKNIEFWYKQNIFLIVNSTINHNIEEKSYFLPYFHPDVVIKYKSLYENCYTQKKEIIAGKITTFLAFKIFLKSIFKR